MAVSIFVRNGVFSLVGAAIVVLLAIGIDEGIKTLDDLLIPCQHGTKWINGKCSCIDTPFVGKYCSTCNCTTGYCVKGGTTPRIASEYGCRCPKDNKFFGFLCDQCNAVNKTFSDTTPPKPETCTGVCKDNFFGSKCERACFADVKHSATLSDKYTKTECEQYAASINVPFSTIHTTLIPLGCSKGAHSSYGSLTVYYNTHDDVSEIPSWNVWRGHMRDFWDGREGCVVQHRNSYQVRPLSSANRLRYQCTSGEGLQNILSSYGRVSGYGGREMFFNEASVNNNFVDLTLSKIQETYFPPGVNTTCTNSIFTCINKSAEELSCRNLRLNGGTCNACSGHGTCEDGFCKCFDNWFDDNLEKCSKTCPLASNGKVCSGRGTCKLYGDTPGCLCESGWRGTDCSVACPGLDETGVACNGHGSCFITFENDQVQTECACNDKYRGDACEVECPGVGEACSGHGTCTVTDNIASCTCDTGMLTWSGSQCNCTNLLSCNGRGTCVNGRCQCEGNFDGENCLKCKPNYWGSQCQWYCDADADHDNDPTKVGCHGRGTCTVFNMDTVSESIGCTCRRDESLQRIDGKVVALYSAFSPDINCKDCYGGFFPKLNVFNTYDTTPLKLFVPCQIPCTETTCNELGICNTLYGKPGESLCSCDTGPQNNKHVSDASYCTKCESYWFPEKVRDDNGCTNFCVSDLSLIGGSFPSECDSGDINCVQCNGAGTCNAEGVCECEEGFTGTNCQLQCTAPDGVVCGGHGRCEASELQMLLQHELVYVEDSGPQFTCICDPQDTYTKEARAQYIAEGGEGSLDPPPEPTFFGETCDFHCERPPWSGSEECNGLGNCTIFPIKNPNDGTYECRNDADCGSTELSRIISADSTWTEKKGPFCHKSKFPAGCENDIYDADKCLDILRLQRPPQMRSKECVENALCRHALDEYDWHDWCVTKDRVSSPEVFESCGSINHFCTAYGDLNIDSECTDFCPAHTINEKCRLYVDISNGTSISNHMDFCYEDDKKKYPFRQTLEYRLADESTVLHDKIDDEMVQYHTEYPSVDIDITPYCVEHMKKFDLAITNVGKNERYLCGSTVISDVSECFTTTDETNWTPFSVSCLQGEVKKYSSYAEAENNRGENCIVREDESRAILSNAGFITFGGFCYVDKDCKEGVCNGNTCCQDFDFTNCEKCNNIGECASCKPGTTWDGSSCTGTPEEVETTEPRLSGVEQKEGLDIVDNTCATIQSKFPVCLEPNNPCEINACKEGDRCVPKGNDAICETDGILDCSCGFGLECVPLSFTTYKCIGDFVASTCPQKYQNFNWAQYCKENNPVVNHIMFGSRGLNAHNPTSGYSVVLSSDVDYVSYWVQPTTIVSPSKYVELKSGFNIVARVYLHQGQIQLNSVASLQSCPNTNPTCHDDWRYETEKWYSLQLYIDYVQRQVTLTRQDNAVSLTVPFLCISQGCSSITAITEFVIQGATKTYYDEILFEKAIPKPSLINDCGDYPYCDMDVNYRSICSDIVRNVEYPLLLEPKHDILETCSDFFEFQSFKMYDLSAEEESAIQQLDWDTYCLFTESVQSDFHCHVESLTKEECEAHALSVNLPFTSIHTNLLPLGCSTGGDPAFGIPSVYFNTHEDLVTKPTWVDWRGHMHNLWDDREGCVLQHKSSSGGEQKWPSGDRLHYYTCPKFHAIVNGYDRYNYEIFNGWGGQPGFKDMSLSKVQETYFPPGITTDCENSAFTCLTKTSSTCGEFCWTNRTYHYFEDYNQCRDLLNPLDGSKQCMQQAMNYDWTRYCFDLELASIPDDIKNVCPPTCYKHLQEYTECDERLEMFDSNTHLKESNCPDKWYSFCHEVSLDKHVGTCSGIDCKCDIDKFEGVSGNACELHCTVASDGSACGELSGVGKCDYTDEQKVQLEAGTYDADGNLVAFTNVFELNGECQCFLSEGTRNCDQECLNCNNDAYNEIVVSPSDQSQWSGSVVNTQHLHLGDSDTTHVSQGDFIVLDMREDDVISGVTTNNVVAYEVSVSMDNEYFEELTCGGESVCQPSTIDAETTLRVHGYGRFVKFTFLQDAQVRGLGVKITRSGQVGICNGGTGMCDCLPPYTAIVEEKYVNWRGVHRKRLRRVHSLPDYYNADDEFRIRAMQGKEVFTKNILKLQNNELAYTEGNWQMLYDSFRDSPTQYKCMPDRNCTHHDFILLGNLERTSYRYNYDCNFECEGVDPITKIPCSGHGSCRPNGDCMCDPAAYVRGVNEVTGFTVTLNLGEGEKYEDSNYLVSALDRTGWRGPSCDVQCPGYDPVAKSMLNVCNGHGICNDDALCECELGYTGEFCQFTCPGFQNGDDNVCSGHGSCVVNVIEVVNTEEIFLYDGYCTDWKFIGDGYVYNKTIDECINSCAQICTEQEISAEECQSYANEVGLPFSVIHTSLIPFGCSRGGDPLYGVPTVYFNIDEDLTVKPTWNVWRSHMRDFWSGREGCVVEHRNSYKVVPLPNANRLRYQCTSGEGLQGILSTFGRVSGYGGREIFFNEPSVSNNFVDLSLSKIQETYFPPGLNTSCGTSAYECIKQRKCGTYTASVRQSNSQCFCSAVECPEENRVERGVVRTYTTAGHAGALTPIDCDGIWSPWSSCDGERQTRTFSVTTEPEYGGQECPVPVEYRTCYLPNTDCVGYWSPYSDCINGYENRTFQVTREPVRFGLSCPLSPQKRVCTLPKIDCDGTWSSWSACDPTTSTQQRTFQVTQTPENNGLACPESPHVISCTQQQVNCEYTNNGWGECQNGLQTKVYVVTQSAKFGGMACPMDETRSCNTCTDNSKCASSLCLNGQCCKEEYPLCASCNNDGYCTRCIEHASEQINGKCECDDTFVYTNGECKPAWDVQREPLYEIVSEWNEYTTCLAPGFQTRVRNKEVSLAIGHDFKHNFFIDGLNDPHFIVEMQMMDTEHYSVPYVDTYSATVSLSRISEGYDARIVRESDCPSCHTGEWTVEPISTVFNVDGTHLPDIKFGEPAVKWSPSNLVVSSDATVYISVKVVNGVFVFEPELNEIEVGRVYQFDLSHPSNSDHPLQFGFTFGLKVSHGCVENPNYFPGQIGATLTFSPVQFDHNKVYSYCRNHGFSMGKEHAYGKVGSHGIYYMITPENPLMVVKFTVEQNFTGSVHSYEKRSCNLIDDYDLCSHSRECENGACIEEASGNTKRCSSDPLCKTIDETQCVACRDGASGTPCQCSQSTESIGDDLLQCSSGYRRRLEEEVKTNECQTNSDCDSSMCLGGRCCKREEPNCEECNQNGFCKRCMKDTRWMNGECRPINCQQRYGHVHMKFVEGKGCVHTLGSTSCSDNSQCGEGTNGICLGGVCCNVNYTDTANCRACNDGNLVWEYYAVSGYLEGGLDAEATCMDSLPNCANLIANNEQFCTSQTRSACVYSCNICPSGVEGNINYYEPLGYLDAIQICDEETSCKGIYHREDNNRWFLRRTDQVVVSSQYTSYVKRMKENVFCAECFDGSTYFEARNKCVGNTCPIGQEWVDNVGCVTKKGEVDENMQFPVQLALDKAWCSPGFYRDVTTNICKPIIDRPIINVTLFIDENTEDEIKITLGCEVLDTNKVQCPQCNCLFDFIYGKWTSFTCETCLKGYGKKQCRKQCPTYDGENDISMCSGHGTCEMGSFINENGDRLFRDATCTCGSPPGSVNEAGTEMMIYNGFYTSLTTLIEEKQSVQCHNEEVLNGDMVDVCYHFDDTLADCSKCEDDFSGLNCRYKCEKCLLGGRCDNTPSNERNAECQCKEISGTLNALWSFNCCPIGFKVTDIERFNALPYQSSVSDGLDVDSIAMTSKYNPSRYNTVEEAERNADYWCKPCPGVDDSIDGTWLTSRAQFEVCGGFTRGECYRKNTTHNGCRCKEGNGGNLSDTSQDWGGMACRCNANYPVPYENLQKDYGCNGVGQCLDDVIEIDGIIFACAPNAGYYTDFIEITDNNGQPTGAFQSKVTPAFVGTHVPYDGKFYTTDLHRDDATDCIYGSEYQDINQVDYCHRCNFGYYQNEAAQTTCKMCGMGAVSQPYGRVTECMECPHGTYASRLLSGAERPTIEFTERATVCLGCPGGRYQNQRGQNQCIQCPAGKYNPVVDFNNALTGAGQMITSVDGDMYQQDEALKNYTQIFSSVSVESIACLNCPDGRYLEFNHGEELYGITTVESQNELSDCQLCPAGRAGTGEGKTNLDDACSMCAPGQYTDGPGQAECKLCELGRHASLSGLDECETCESGQYSDELGIEYCKVCDPGMYSNDDVGFSSCTECSVGKYADGPGQAECTSCPHGKTTVRETATGSTNVDDCEDCVYAGFTDEACPNPSCGIWPRTRTYQLKNDVDGDYTNCPITEEIDTYCGGDCSRYSSCSSASCSADTANAALSNYHTSTCQYVYSHCIHCNTIIYPGGQQKLYKLVYNCPNGAAP